MSPVLVEAEGGLHPGSPGGGMGDAASAEGGRAEFAPAPPVRTALLPGRSHSAAVPAGDQGEPLSHALTNKHQQIHTTLIIILQAQPLKVIIFNLIVFSHQVAQIM